MNGATLEALEALHERHAGPTAGPASECMSPVCERFRVAASLHRIAASSAEEAELRRGFGLPPIDELEQRVLDGNR
jgi:hypothetical protein